MFLNRSVDIVKKARRIVKLAGSRDPEIIADYLGIIIMPCAFSMQKGGKQNAGRTPDHRSRSCTTAS